MTGRTVTTLFLCGDVMTGRGIDQILPHPSQPRLYEPYLNSARAYVELAERVNGPLPRPVDYAYVWGDALAELRHRAPAARIVNLETAITTSDQHWPGKGIHYRMHPSNLPCLTAAGIDCCVLANNHVLDWGTAGLEETIATLRGAGVRTAGAGADLEAARTPVVIELPARGRVLVFAFATASSGVPADWAAGPARPGVDRLPDLSKPTLQRIRDAVRAVKRPGDVAVASIHWDGNWGYAVPAEHTRFAHDLIDQAAIDVVHGHSSHHPKAIEVYRGRPILYGCGDMLNDYEGIGGDEEYRADLVLMYFLAVEPASGALVGLTMVPMRLRRFRLNRVSGDELDWICGMMNRQAGRFGARVELEVDGALGLRWN